MQIEKVTDSQLNALIPQEAYLLGLHFKRIGKNR